MLKTPPPHSSFLTIVTRVHPARKNSLKRNIESVKSQTSDDYEHVLFRDDKSISGYGMLMANQSLQRVSGINGKYVMVLDDDDELIDKDFVKELKIVAADDPDIVFFRCILRGDETIPPDFLWKKPPQRGGMNSFCFVVAKKLWETHISEFGTAESAGDWMFIKKCYANSNKFLWWDRIVARTQRGAGHGRPE